MIERLRLGNILQETKRLEKDQKKETASKSKKSKSSKVSVEKNAESDIISDIEAETTLNNTENVQNDSIVCESPLVETQILDSSIDKTVNLDEVFFLFF